MLQKLKKIFFITSLTVFGFLTINYYFSEKNIIHINKSRSAYSKNYDIDLPILKNDTNNIIVYKNDKILCVNHRKGHFEGVLNIMNRLLYVI